MRPIARHSAAWAAAAILIAVLPGIAAELSWRIEDLLGQSGGMSFYVRGWRSGETAVTKISHLINPFSPGALMLLFVLLVCSLVGERMVAKHQWLRLAYPAMPAIAVATILAAATAVVLPPDLPRSVPLVVGLSACVSIGLLASVHWGVLRWLA
jgi:hypothetical protein